MKLIFSPPSVKTHCNLWGLVGLDRTQSSIPGMFTAFGFCHMDELLNARSLASI